MKCLNGQSTTQCMCCSRQVPYDPLDEPDYDEVALSLDDVFDNLHARTEWPPYGKVDREILSRAIRMRRRSYGANTPVDGFPNSGETLINKHLRGRA